MDLRITGVSEDEYVERIDRDFGPVFRRED
jgi:hypothetical protein